MMGDGSVGRFHAAQVSGDVGSYDKAGELPGKKIEGDQRNHHQQKNRNHADENIGNDPVSYTHLDVYKRQVCERCTN